MSGRSVARSGPSGSDHEAPRSARPLAWPILAISLAVLLTRAVQEAWVGEDAFITFRVVDNFVNGFGLRWNVDERVMTYTHPLWMLASAAAYSLTHEVPYTVTGLGLLFTAATYCLLWYRFRDRPLLLTIGLLVPWACSPSLVLYATSGFETSLSILLIALFAVSLLDRGRRDARTRWGWIGLTAGLMVTNRPDTLLLCGPPIALLLVAEQADVDWPRFSLGLAPLASWLVFSVLYYGFPYPNTAPAKLSPDFPLGEFVRRGLRYASALDLHDPVAAIALWLGITVALVCSLRYARDRTDWRAGRLAAFGGGALLYCLYLIRIGGDFLAGRLFVPPVFAALLIIVFGSISISSEARERPRQTAIVAVASLVSLLAAHRAALENWRSGFISPKSVANLKLQPDLTWEPSERAAIWRADGEAYAERARNSDERVVVIDSTIGFTGFAAGPEVTVIDPLGLGDALIARLPLDQRNRRAWRIGHLPRSIPDGYLEARRSGSLDGMDPDLRRYYEKLSLVTMGPLFDPARLRTILGFQLGRYDYILDGWKRRQRGVDSNGKLLERERNTDPGEDAYEG